ncbi:MAG: hypothetical protein ACP5IZ_03870 [Thermoprotei archaeon]
MNTQRTKKHNNMRILFVTVIAYLVLVYLFTPVYLIRYYGYSFTLVVLVGSLTSLITFGFSWYVYMVLLSTFNRLNRRYVIMGLLILLVPIELFYIIPVFYGEIIIYSIKPMFPYTSYLLEQLEDLPSITQFIIMWIVPMIIIPVSFYVYSRRIERPILIKERKKARKS